MDFSVLIRADGSKAIGMGHLSRSILLYNALNKTRNLSIRLCIKENIDAKKFLYNKIEDIIYLNPQLDFKSEAEEIINIVQKNKINIVVLDLLEQDIDNEYMSILNTHNFKIFVITDDSNKRIINADYVINGNPWQFDIDYSGERAKYFLGPKYFIMDENYNVLYKNKKDHNPKHVLMTFGGSDHNNLLFKVLDAVKLLKKDFIYLIAVTQATGYIDKLKKYLNDSQLKYELFIDLNGLKLLWERADYAITAGGNTLFERLACAVPGVTICQLDRQMEIADKFSEFNINQNIGLGTDLTTQDISKGLEDFFNNTNLHKIQSKLSRDYVDGSGLSRIIRLIKNEIME